jgi:hypothetical protein
MALRLSMDCQACASLLTAWEQAVKAYTDFGLNGRRLFAYDFRLVANEEERLRVNCNAARDALMAHRQEHCNLVKNAKKRTS